MWLLFLLCWVWNLLFIYNTFVLHGMLKPLWVMCQKDQKTSRASYGMHFHNLKSIFSFCINWKYSARSRSMIKTKTNQKYNCFFLCKLYFSHPNWSLNTIISTELPKHNNKQTKKQNKTPDLSLEMKCICFVY